MPRLICQLTLVLLLCLTLTDQAVARATFVVTSTNPAGPGSLVQALLDSDGSPGTDLITFNIPGDGPHRIDVPGGVEVNSPVVIDGFTQPLSSPNTTPVGAACDADMRIVVHTYDELFLLDSGASGTTLRGIVFQSTAANPNGTVHILADDVTVTGCYMGTDVTGLLPNPGDPQRGLISFGHNTRVGGPDPADRCVISGNARSGVLIGGIGGADVGGDVQGCYVGVAADGVTPMPNGMATSAGYGIRCSSTGPMINFSVRDCIVANNHGSGIEAPGNILAVFSRNSIYDNVYLGIDILEHGPSEHPLVSLPELTSVDAGSGTIEGMFTAFSSGLDYEIEFFMSPECNPSAYGEGKTYLGSLAFTSSSSSPAPFTANFGPLPPLGVVTAVAILDDSISSEFSVCFGVGQPSPPVVTNTDASGPGSLAHAIEQADVLPGEDLVSFNIPGPGPHTITLVDGIDIRSPVIIDGFTQPGAMPNSNAIGEPSNADMRIVINTGTDAIYLRPGSAQSTLRGLVVQTSGDEYSVLVQSFVDDITVSGCYLGTDVSGLLPAPLAAGFGVASSGADLRVGGPDPADRCVISGNGRNGILFGGGSISDRNMGIVEGCYIGVDATGAGAMGNGFETLIGDGIYCNTSGPMIYLQINRNIIANNAGNGILVPGDILASFSQNSIYDNGMLGIDILESGVSEHLLAPLATITSADASTGIIEGTFDAFASSLDYEIEFYSSPTCDSSGYGEGRTYLGTHAFTSSSNSPTPFTVELGPLPPLQSVTAVTILDGTIASEFSLCHEVIQPAAPVVTTGAATGPGSLEQALLEADADPDLTTIEFDLPGPGPHLIAAPPGGLSINSAVLIDGFSQPGSVPNGEAPGKASNAVLTIVIDTPGGPITINPSGAGSLLQGLVVYSDVTAAIENHADNVTVRGCYLGTDPSGMSASGGTPPRGILSTGSALTVGGPALADLCLISANSLAGVEITDGSATILGCYIGTDASGVGALGNGASGGVLTSVMSGMLTTVSNCVVAYNAGPGVRAVDDAPLRAGGNSIYANGGLGIDTGAVGPSTDPLSPAPVITFVDPLTGEIQGTIESPSNSAKFTIEFFANTSCDPSGFGEGELLLGSLQFNAPAAGVVPFVATLGALAHSNGVVATATNESDRTSEFSACSETGTAADPAPVVPAGLRLSQNRPNPFNPATTIAFSVPQEGRVRLEIFDVSGRRVRVLLDEVRDAGPGSVRWDGTSDGGGSVASGVYFYRVEAGGQVATRRMALVR